MTGLNTYSSKNAVLCKKTAFFIVLVLYLKWMLLFEGLSSGNVFGMECAEFGCLELFYKG